MSQSLSKDVENVQHQEDVRGGDIDEKHEDKTIEQARVDDADAARYVNLNIHISPEQDKRLRRKIWRNLVPVMCLAYITQALDKGTLGSAVIMGWEEHVGAHGQDYALTSTLLWIGFIVGEPLVNQFIRRLPVAKVLALSMFTWSVLTLGLAFCLNIPGVFAIRALLGFCESSFGPCLLTITVQWFTVQEQTLTATTWQAMLGLATAIGNLLAYGCYHIKGKNPLHGWQWLTFTTSMISFGATAVVYFFLPDSPTKAKWATEEEKTMYVERVRANDQGLKQKVWKNHQAWEAAKDPMSYLLFIMYFVQSLIVGGLNTFNSLLINRSFGFSVLDSLLVTIPKAVFQMLLYFLAAFLNRRINQTVYIMVSFMIVNIAGSIVLILVEPGNKTRGGLLFAFYLMQCCQATNPSMYAMLSRNIAGQTKKSIVYAIFFMAWAAGNAAGPQLFQSAWKPRYYNSLYIHLGLYVLFIFDVLIMRFILVRRNKKRDAVIGADGQTNLHLHAFEDKTDLENPDFRYHY